MGSRHSRRNGGGRADDVDLLPLSTETDSGPSLQNLPIHELQLQVDPQKASPLYNGKVPPEIRDHIFLYCLQEEPKTDEASVWALDTLYTRPGYSGTRKVDISLLLTCRRIYLETYHLPARTKEHVFFHSSPTTPPHQSNHTNPFGYRIEHDHFTNLQPWQLALVKEIHLFTQMFWLEQTFPVMCRQDFMRGIEKVKITIRRGDWWWNESNHPLIINPYRQTVQHYFCLGEMQQDIAVQERGGTVPWLNSAWGFAFKQLPSLKEVEMEFETSDDKKQELERIVKWAKTWKFPLNYGKVLSTEGLEVTSSSWQSPFCFWSDQCPYCGTHHRNHCNSEGTPNEEKCAERAALRLSGLGPKCHIHSLRWRVAQNPGDSPAEHPLL